MTTHLHVPPLSKECTCVLNSPIPSRAFQGHSETNKQTTQQIKNPTERPVGPI